MAVRKAEPKDVEAIQALINSNLDKLLPRSGSEIAELLEWFWVAEDEGKVVGCCCLEIYSKKIAEIRSVAVAEEYRKKKHGAELIEAATNEAESRGIDQVLVVTSTPAFFEQLNFGPCLNEKFALFWRGKGR